MNDEHEKNKLVSIENCEVRTFSPQTTVEIIHCPTGIFEICNDSNSIIKNKEIAFEKLRKKIVEILEERAND